MAEVEDVPASRGLILDRNGKVLVSNEISYQVTLDMSRMGEPEERCANLLSLIQVAREEGVAWADTLPVSASAPFTYTEEHPFYTASTNEAGEPEYQMTRLGRLAVYMGWIEDPEELAEGEVPEQDAAEQEEPGLWDRLLTLVGLRKPEEPREEPQPYRLPTAEELLGEMCRDLDIKGQGAVDEKAARAAGETVPTLNLGDMTQGDARAVAGCCMSSTTAAGSRTGPPTTLRGCGCGLHHPGEGAEPPGGGDRDRLGAQVETEYAATCWATPAPSPRIPGRPIRRRAATT